MKNYAMRRIIKKGCPQNKLFFAILVMLISKKTNERTTLKTSKDKIFKMFPKAFCSGPCKKYPSKSIKFNKLYLEVEFSIYYNIASL